MITLPKNTILYRTSINNEGISPKYDSDTAKTGLYFSNYPILALSMSIEYDVDMILKVYKTTKEMYLYNGKYSFREINKNRYYVENTLIFNVSVQPEENVNHFDNTLYPIVDFDFELRTNKTDDQGEIFLNNVSLLNIELVKTYEVSKAKLYDSMMTIGVDSLYTYQSALTLV